MKAFLPFKFSRTLVFGLIGLTAGCSDNTELLEGQAKILKELEEIKTALKAAPVRQSRKTKPFEPVDVSLVDAPYLGETGAPVTMIEFTDYQCPYCKRYALSAFPSIQKDYIETGKVRYVLRNFPLKEAHAQADKLAQAALCAGDQDKYWAMHDVIFHAKNKINADDLSAEVKALGLKSKAFDDCLISGKYAAQVDNDLSEGIKLGVRGTPSFFIGKSQNDSANTIRATQMLTGAKSYPEFQEAIENALK